MSIADRLRALAKRTALDGIAEELLAIADSQQATPEPGRCKHGHRHYCGHCGPIPDAATPEPVGEPVEWQARVTGINDEEAWTRILPTATEPTARQRAEHLRKLRRADGQPAYEIRALYPRPAPGVPEGWQPIQTAPTDGTKFLGWRRGRVATAYRVQRDDCEMWSFGGESGAFKHWPEIRPEFWMPHPPEPVLAAAQVKGEKS